MITLKTCPFCGGEATFWQPDRSHENWVVMCKADGNDPDENGRCPVVIETWWSTPTTTSKEEAARLWNTRV